MAVRAPGLQDVFWLSASFFLLFMAYNTTQALVTTIQDKQLADAGLSALYATFTLVSIVAPKIVNQIGPRWSMVAGGAPYVLAVVVNVDTDPNYGIFVPAFALTGMGAGLLWAAQGVYLGRIAVAAARLAGDDVSATVSNFSGVFFAAFQFCGAAGTVIAAIVQSATPAADAERVDQWLFGAFTVVAVLAVAMLYLAEDVPAQSPATAGGGEPSEESGLLPNSTRDGPGAAAAAPGAAAEAAEVSLVETLVQAFTQPEMYLLLPLIFYNGMSLGWFFSDYPAWYSSKESPLLPASRVGFVTAVFYLSNSGFSYLFGRLSGSLGRAKIMTGALAIHVLWFAVMLLLATDAIQLQPDSAGTYTVVFLMAIVFAAGDSVWESVTPAVLQSPAFMPAERNREAAMANFKMWQSLGFAVQFGLDFAITTQWVKLTINAALLVLSLAGFVALQLFVRSVDGDRRGGSPRVSGGSAADMAKNPAAAGARQRGVGEDMEQGFQEAASQPMLS